MKLFRSPPLPKIQSRAWVGAHLAADRSSLPLGWSDSLFNRLVLAGDPRVSIVPILDKWVDEGKPVEKRDLQWMVKQMRAFRRYSHALQISTWMSDRRYFTLSPGDIADRLGLLSKVHDIAYTENYFNNISKQLKVRQPYGALLNCYAEAKDVEKAEALFQEMKELKLLKPFCYNILVKLYSLTGQHRKVDTIFQEMERKRFRPDNFTYNIFMDAYVIACDISGIEKLLKRINHSSLGMNWHIYATAAKGYSKAGLIDKALLALKKSEELVPRKKTRIAYGFLLSVYTDMGIKDELYRIWNKYKSSEETSVSMYMCMISCLLKLDDISSAEAILKEWELLSVLYDFRVPNLLVAAYCKKGLLCKAESIVRDAVRSGGTPFANTWEYLAGSYFDVNQIPKAVEIMKKALVAHGNSLWKPKPENVSASLEYFKVQQDVKAAEEFVSLLRRVSPLTREVYHCLLSIYVIVGKSVSGVLHRMKEDGFDADEETHKILGSGNSGKSSVELCAYLLSWKLKFLAFNSLLLSLSVPSDIYVDERPEILCSITRGHRRSVGLVK